LDFTKPLDDELYHFWIYLDAKTQLIYVGQGEHPCEEDAFIIFKDPSFLSNVQYFTFTSNYLAITYMGIKHYWETMGKIPQVICGVPSIRLKFHHNL
jgi:hypothetical protein